MNATRAGALAAHIVGLIVNRKGVGAMARAERLGVPTAVFNPREFSSIDQWDQAMVDQARLWKADWVILAGFLALIGPRMLAAFPQRIVNSHPALLPKFGGAGMYGLKVHAAVIQAREAETGITIHTIDEEYDRGSILAQEKVLVSPEDTPETLAERVKAHEVLFYPKVLNDLVTGRITIG